jgi:uncharacterized protein with PQ loop repeat
MLTLISIIGSFLLAFSNVPQMIKSCLDKNSNGVSILTLIIGIVGLGMLFIYVSFTYMDLCLMFNYGFNVFVLGVILYWKLFPKEK